MHLGALTSIRLDDQFVRGTMDWWLHDLMTRKNGRGWYYEVMSGKGMENSATDALIFPYQARFRAASWETSHERSHKAVMCGPWEFLLYLYARLGPWASAWHSSPMFTTQIIVNLSMGCD